MPFRFREHEVEFGHYGRPEDCAVHLRSCFTDRLRKRWASLTFFLIFLRVNLEGSTAFIAHYESSWLAGFLRAWRKSRLAPNVFSLRSKRRKTKTYEKKNLYTQPKINRGQGSERGQAYPCPQCVCVSVKTSYVCMCVRMCVRTFATAKPNKHHPSASQGERTQVSVRVQLSRQGTASHQPVCVCVRGQNTECREGDLSLTTIHSTVYCASINTLLYKDNLQWACQQVVNNCRGNFYDFIHHHWLLNRVWCNPVAWVKDWGETLKLNSSFNERNLKARHISPEDLALAKHPGSIALSLFSSTAWKWIQEASDRYNTCMWHRGSR